LTPTGLGTLPTGSIGSQITHDFGIEDMLFQALLLHWYGVPTDMLWHPNGPLYRNNQVFPAEAFWDLLKNLWAASGSGRYQTPPIYAQPLITMANPWFDVQAGRSVTVLWVYLERAHAWYQQLSPEVQNMLGPFDHMLNNFPHYSTLDTELTPMGINLLTNFTAWVIMSVQPAFTALFQPAVAARG
jgi:hypothetical protein